MTRAWASLTLTLCLFAFPGGIPAQTPAETFEVAEATIPQMQEWMARGEITSVELVDAYLARIDAYDRDGPALQAIIRINPQAREEAVALDEERRTAGIRGPLHGIPIILKDNYDTADMPTSAGSVALAGYYPAYDGFQVRRLREAGAVVLAKSNLHELAMGITTISSLGDQTRNPYDLTRNPGGSSGGTGAAIAASFAAVGMGSDTCGSIRIPSAQNNLVGLRPTKGLSSISGIIPLSHTQDVGGPLARNVTDLAIVLDATVGDDPDDPATEILQGYTPRRFVDALNGATLEGARFGKLTALIEGAEAAVTEVIEAAFEHLASQGAELVEVEVPGLRDLMQKSGVINYEFKFDFIDYLAANPGAPVESLTEILDLGMHHTALRRSFERRNRIEERDSDEYLAALKWRGILRDAVVQVLDENELDALLYPTLTRRPSRIGEPQAGSNCSLSANSGLPALSIPAGFTSDLLPVGLELLGRRLADPALLALGFAFEQSTDHRRAPAVTPPLVDGEAPAPISFRATARPAREGEFGIPGIAAAAFTFDPLRNKLAYAFEALEVPADEVYAATLHRGGSGDGPAIARLSGLGVGAAEGTIDLSPLQRQALEAGELWLRVFTRTDPTGRARGQLALPG